VSEAWGERGLAHSKRVRGERDAMIRAQYSKLGESVMAGCVEGNT
jgi:hypothetical protein